METPQKDPKTDLFNIDTDKSVMTVETQKELITHRARTSFLYSMLSLLIILPLMLGLIFGSVYFVFSLLGINIIK